MRDLLREICDRKSEYIAAQKQSVPEAVLYERALLATTPRGFHAVLKKHVADGGIGLIAEIKKASPSKGVIRKDFDAARIAKSYAAGGSACLSVLTDAPYFHGADDYLVAARAAVSLPVLRKDFMLDPYQIIEARSLGADCILLIMAALADAQAGELESIACELGMDVLVEIHNRDELDRALTHLKSRLLGINNRNLKTLEVNLNTSGELCAAIPAGYTPVCESGIATHGDINLMRGHGIHCFLVGESLMRQADITAATRALLGNRAL